MDAFFFDCIKIRVLHRLQLMCDSFKPFENRNMSFYEQSKIRPYMSSIEGYVRLTINESSNFPFGNGGL